MKTIIVGGVAGGASAATRLRRLDETAEIVIYERGPFISYANCGLPYFVGGDIANREELLLETPETLKLRYNIDVHIHQQVLSVNPLAHEVSVQNLINGDIYTDHYDKLVLAPGAEPIIPPLPGVDSPLIFSLRTVPDTVRIKNFISKEKPESVLIIGGGYIGIEMAENLTKAGLQVTVAEMTDHVIPLLDYDMAALVHQHLRAHGVKLLLGESVKSFVTGGASIKTTIGDQTYEYDMAILSVGVRPDTKFLASSGLKMTPRGAIITDTHMQTSDPDIYAVGDAVSITNFVTGQDSYIPLAGPANKQGRIAGDNIAGLSSTYKGSQGAAILRVFDRTVATIGLTEVAIQKTGIKYHKIYCYHGSSASYYPGSADMTIKLYFEQGSARILGAQIIGQAGVDKRIDVISVAMRAGLSAEDLADAEIAYAPPFSAAKDAINIVGYMAQNVNQGLVKQFYIEDADKLPRDGSVTILDVRSAGEFRRGHLEGAINIPVDYLRDNLISLSQTKPVYLYCQSGFRSYLALRILAQKGFQAAHLAGGYRLFSLVESEKAKNRI